MQTATTLEKPKRYAIGSIESVENVRLSSKGLYTVADINIAGEDASPDKTFYLVFLPEFFDPDFDLQSLTATEEGNKIYGVFKKHIKSANENATLQIILGDEFAAFEEAVDGLNLPDYTDDAAREAIGNVLREALVGVKVGYVLAQQTEKNDDGTKTLSDNYSVDSFFKTDAETREKIEKRVEKQRKGLKPLLLWNE